MAIKTVYLIRHGQSESNAGQKTSGSANIPITLVGEKQAWLITDSFSFSPELLVVSPYSRALESAKPLLKKFPSLRYKCWPVQEFTYLCDAGYKNTTYSERKAGREAYWNLADPYVIDGEGAESFRHFISRVDDFLKKISERKERTIAVFTHGQFIRGVILRILAPELMIGSEMMKRFRKLNKAVPIPNGAIAQLLIRDGRIFISGPSVKHIPNFLETD